MSRYLIAHTDEGYGWPHVFIEQDPDTGRPVDRERIVDFVLDRETGEFLFLDIPHHTGTNAEKADLLEDLKDNDAIENPAEWSLEVSDEIPDWAAQQPGPR